MNAVYYTVLIVTPTQDFETEVRKVVRFLGKDINEEKMAKLLKHLSFESFQKNPMVNFDPLKSVGLLDPDAKFMRKGILGLYNSDDKGGT